MIVFIVRGDKRISNNDILIFDKEIIVRIVFDEPDPGKGKKTPCQGCFIGTCFFENRHFELIFTMGIVLTRADALNIV